MQSISQFALAASILSSIMGALVVCVLVFRYGFTIPAQSDAEDGPTPTDVLVTRVGHAVAGACFVATAVLAIVALSLRPPEESAALPTGVVAPGPVAAVGPATPPDGAGTSRAERGVEEIELRIARAQSHLAQLDDEIRSKAARVALLEQKRTPARRQARAPARSTVATRRDRSTQVLATAREEWHASRQRAAGLVGGVRAAFARAERTVVRHVGTDPRGRVSARD